MISFSLRNSRIGGPSNELRVQRKGTTDNENRKLCWQLEESERKRYIIAFDYWNQYHLVRDSDKMKYVECALC